VTGDPAEEAERRRQMHDLEAAARHGEIDDPVRAVRIRLPGSGGRTFYGLAYWSLAKRQARNAAEAGHPGEFTDLGPLPGAPAPEQAGGMVAVGVTGPDGRWEDITPGRERLAQAIADLERGLS
jgi:hypothetical protein